jgi:hypothetical protein
MRIALRCVITNVVVGWLGFMDYLSVCPFVIWVGYGRDYLCMSWVQSSAFTVHKVLAFGPEETSRVVNSFLALYHATR